MSFENKFATFLLLYAYHKIGKKISLFCRYIFWTEMVNRSAIGRIYMDGTSKSYIATTGLKTPTGLAIDYSCKVLIS